MNFIEVDGIAVCEPDLLKWAAWFEKADRVVVCTTVGEVMVSTVFLGIDHQWGKGPRILYETMVFGGEFAEDQRRYATRDEAETGHREVCEKVFSMVKE